ncbi:hypothetical protein pipiens_018639 [Culex pipiens pipiens]|uniref:Uncharacterized protein n=1 Tax=Culex pipiens pipiens TaxID=38569 RepID=A0ABD1CAW2_CULPP
MCQCVGRKPNTQAQAQVELEVQRDHRQRLLDKIPAQTLPTTKVIHGGQSFSVTVAGLAGHAAMNQR